MKKMIVVLFAVSFLGACISMVPPAIRVNNAIEKVGGQHAITENISVVVSGNYDQDITDVFYDFGFTIVRAKEKADYVVEVETQNLGWGESWGYYIYPIKLRMRITEKNGKEYYYKADGVFKHFVSHAGSTYQTPNDPYGLAAKIAATKIVKKFIQEQGFLH